MGFADSSVSAGCNVPRKGLSDYYTLARALRSKGETGDRGLQRGVNSQPTTTFSKIPCIIVPPPAHPGPDIYTLARLRVTRLHERTHTRERRCAHVRCAALLMHTPDTPWMYLRSSEFISATRFSALEFYVHSLWTSRRRTVGSLGCRMSEVAKRGNHFHRRVTNCER